MQVGTTPSIGRRAALLDEIRGVCIVLMVLYHGAYDLVYFFNVDIPLFHTQIAHVFQRCLAGTFILLSGVCCRYSRSNLRRGVVAFALGMAMTVATLLFMPQAVIRFGILHFLGCCMILFALLHRVTDKMSPVVLIAMCALLVPFTRHIVSGWVGIEPFLRIDLPRSLYELPFLFPIGIMDANFSSSDYFPLIPWAFVFFAGTGLGALFTRHSMPQWYYTTHCRWLAAAGRHTIYIYLMHQPVLFGLLWLFLR